MLMDIFCQLRIWKRGWFAKDCNDPSKNRISPPPSSHLLISTLTWADGRIWASKVRRLPPRAARQGRAPQSGSQNSSSRPGGGRQNIASSFPWTLDSGKFKQILKNGNLEDWSGLKDPVKVKIQTVSKAENFKPFEDAKPTKVTINQRDPFLICSFSICRPAAGRREPI